jgi:hypothetical protein
MENSIRDFEEWVNTLVTPDLKFFAVFDPSSGKISGIYPDHSCPDVINKIEVDEEISLSVLEGRSTLHSYIVDVDSEKIEFIENKHLKRLDDVLHRIIEDRWAVEKNTDVSLTVDKKQKKIKIELDNKFYKSRKIYWDGNTEMLFLITDYNDPNGLYDTVSLTIDQLFEKKSIEFNIDIPDDFSIYTRRIFKNYILKNENN